MDPWVIAIVLFVLILILLFIFRMIKHLWFHARIRRALKNGRITVTFPHTPTTTTTISTHTNAGATEDIITNTENVQNRRRAGSMVRVPPKLYDSSASLAKPIAKRKLDGTTVVSHSSSVIYFIGYCQLIFITTANWLQATRIFRLFSTANSSVSSSKRA